MGLFKKKERRRFARKQVELVITCYLPRSGAGDKHEFKCNAQDISPKGIKLIVPKKIRVGDELILLLDKPLAIKPVLVKGRIQWLKKLDRFDNKKDQMQIGVEFIHVTSYVTKKLDLLIDEVEATNRLIRKF